MAGEEWNQTIGQPGAIWNSFGGWNNLKFLPTFFGFAENWTNNGVTKKVPKEMPFFDVQKRRKWSKGQIAEAHIYANTIERAQLISIVTLKPSDQGESMTNE